MLFGYQGYWRELVRFARSVELVESEERRGVWGERVERRMSAVVSLWGRKG